MAQVLLILFGAALAVSVSVALGTLLVRALGLRFYRQEERFFAFVAGAACLSMLIFVLGAGRMLYPASLLALGILILAAGAWRGAWKPDGEPLRPPDWRWRALFWALFALFTYPSFFHALAPEMSPDGSQYHLGLVRRFLEVHGFVHVHSLWAYFPQGTELLYLFAFAFGKHSAAALVHFAFEAALPFGILLYARRFGFAPAGIVAALLVYLSPIINWDGSTAYIDVAVACVVFALFYLLQIWDEDRQPGLLVLIGLLAGFAYGMKYTAFVATPYALGFVFWKSWRKGRHTLRSAAVVAVCALVMIAPWMIRNWVWTGNPLAPFYNQWFPNPYIHIAAEQGLRAQLMQAGGVTDWRQIPLETTVRGEKLHGFLGPVFLLAPLGLAALWHRQGRQLLLAAAVFLSTYPSNIGTRFLIPAAVFLALAMSMVLIRWKPAAVLVLCAHAVLSWPRFQHVCCGPTFLAITRVPVRAALRIEPEDAFLSYWRHDYRLARFVEERTPPGSKIFAISGPPMAYSSRDVMGFFDCAECNNVFEMVMMPVDGSRGQIGRRTFRFSPRQLSAVRVRQIGTGTAQDGWGVREVHVMSGAVELSRTRAWRVRAQPNPWEAGMALDANPVTEWKSWQPLNRREWIELDFSAPVQTDGVAVDGDPGQAVRLQLEARDAAGNWRALAMASRETSLPPPAGMRRLISRELHRRGIGYMLVPDDWALATDLRTRGDEWGISLLGESGNVGLYRID